MVEDTIAAKTLLILGATGGTGQHVVAQALHRGFVVTALARDPARLNIASDRLHVLAGSVTDEATLAAAMRGQDAVISTLGVGKSFRSGGIIGRAVPLIVSAMEAEGTRRLILTSAFGVGETRRDTPVIPRLFIRTFLRDICRDKEVGEAALRRSGLEWTLVYPTGLADRPGTGQYRVGERLALRGFPTIARADVADFLLNSVADGAYLRRCVLVSS